MLEFDHRPASVRVTEVTLLMRGGHAWPRIEAEMAKCDVRCRSCHARVTYQRAGANWRTRAEEGRRTMFS